MGFGAVLKDILAEKKMSIKNYLTLPAYHLIPYIPLQSAIR